MTNVTASLLIASSKSLSVTAMMFSGGCFEVVLCVMAMWFESSAARTAANASEVGEIVVPPFPSGTGSLPYCWECIGPFYWTRSLRGVVAVPLVRISGGWGALNSKKNQKKNPCGRVP